MSDWARSIADTDESRSKAMDRAARKREWVTGGEHTAAELLAMERARKAAFYENEARRAAA